MNDSVRKAIQLLEELARFKNPVPLRDLAHRTHLNKATAFRLLNSLREKGFVQKIGEQRLYALGPTLLAFAEDYRRNFTMRDSVMLIWRSWSTPARRRRSIVNGSNMTRA